MKLLKRSTALLVVILAFPSFGVLLAQDANGGAAATEVTKRLEDLQKQLTSLQQQISELKKQQEAAAAASSRARVIPAANAQAPAPVLANAGPPGSAPALLAPLTLQEPAPAAPAAPAAATPAVAAPAESGLTGLLGPMNVTGFVDGYYSYDFEHPHASVASVPAGTSGADVAGFRAFDAPIQQLRLNMVELTIAKPPDASNNRLGYDLTFGFGNAMNVVNSTDPGGLGFAQYLKEAYFSYLAPVGKGLQIDFGKFVTQHGAEVIETKDNWNYSRGILFSYAIPFYHFGLRSKYALNDKYNFSAYLVNGWNNIVDNNTGKTVGLQFGWTPNKKVSFVQNYMVGPEETGNNDNIRELWDSVVTYTPTGKLSLMANYDYGRGDRMAGVSNVVWWSGIAGYARYAFNDKYALALRYEYYDDKYGFTTGNAQHLNEGTLTFERIVAKHLITRWEYRHDESNRPSLLKGTVPVSHQNTVTAGLVYTFDVKEK